MAATPNVRPGSDPLARQAVRALHGGDVAALGRLLARHPGLARERLSDGSSSRSLLHILADHPGHRPAAAELARLLIGAGADVDARFDGSHTDTPLHWAASSGDLALLDALLEHGADIEADGAVIAGGTPLADAVAFAQWPAARRLVACGAQVSLWQAAALGLDAVVNRALDGTVPTAGGGQTPSPRELTEAFWCACHGGQLQIARTLLRRGADRDWRGFDDLTPLGAAQRSGADPVASWLTALGAST